jgi:SpoVK/Ycf46/Vps4 family AAA+-type ATPase
VLSREIRMIYPTQDRVKIMNEFKEGVHFLQKQGLIETKTKKSKIGNYSILILTDKGKVELLGKDAKIYIHEEKNNLLTYDKIVEKQPFFSPQLENQLSLLRNSLNQEYYKGLCERLEKNNLPKGIAVLLYGKPGTGKTESVMQIAKATGRDIMHVDISATKSCWFGESEKLIKKVFTDYRRICEKSKVKPILLFNEADAVFSTRKDFTGSDRGVDQTENAIQNIILEEMENLDGILIATTNLADNLDKAFERRFLFKIYFDLPTIEAKTNIWKDKLPTLSTEEATTLASTFEFSGGQIDNIVRKSLMQEVISGNKPTLTDLITMCSEEKISKNSVRKMGFC